LAGLYTNADRSAGLKGTGGFESKAVRGKIYRPGINEFLMVKYAEAHRGPAGMAFQCSFFSLHGFLAPFFLRKSLLKKAIWRFTSCMLPGSVDRQLFPFPAARATQRCLHGAPSNERSDHDSCTQECQKPAAENAGKRHQQARRNPDQSFCFADVASHPTFSF
jgi:hypothetical protein